MKMAPYINILRCAYTCIQYIIYANITLSNPTMERV